MRGTLEGGVAGAEGLDSRELRGTVASNTSPQHLLRDSRGWKTVREAVKSLILTRWPPTTRIV